MKYQVYYPKNISEPVLEVRHAELERRSDESAYKSKCPTCPEGVLLMRCDNKTLELLKDDRCHSCGQQVLYLDIDEFSLINR